MYNNNELYEINIDKLAYSLETGKQINVDEYIDRFNHYKDIKRSIETLKFYLNNMNVRSTEGIKEVFGKIWNWFKGICLKIWNWIKGIFKWFLNLFKGKMVRFKDVAKWIDKVLPQLSDGEIARKTYEYMRKETLKSPIRFNDKINYKDFFDKIVSNDITDGILENNNFQERKENGIVVTRKFSIKESFDNRINKILELFDNLEKIFQQEGGPNGNQINTNISLFYGGNFSYDDFIAIARHTDKTSLVRMLFESNFGVEFTGKSTDVHLNEILGIYSDVDVLYTMMNFKDLFENTQLFNRSYTYDSKTLNNITDTLEKVIKRIDNIKKITANNNLNEGTQKQLNETITEISNFINGWSSYVSDKSKLMAEYINTKYGILEMFINTLAMICIQFDSAVRTMSKSISIKHGIVKTDADVLVADKSKFDLTGR